MKKIALLALSVGAACLMACSGDNNQNDGGTDGSVDVNNDVTKTDGGSDASDGGNPAPPTLKTQVDRMGRPAINTALNHVFDTTSAAGTAKDTYNADKNLAGWTTAYAPEFAKNLAVFDALDSKTTPGDGCGNQIAYAKSNSYSTLAGVVADDRLYLNTAGATCTTYLAVEANVLGITNTDCGGRGLKYDVIDATYSAVSVGAFTGVTDGIAADTTKTGGTTFPYLAAPQ